MDPTPLWDFDDLPASLARFETARARATRPDADVLATQQARALGLLGRFDEGHALLDGLPDDDAEVAVRRHLERGRLQRSAGVEDRGRSAFDAAAELAQQRRHQPPFGGLYIDALHMLAILPDDAAEQVRLGRLALAAAEESNDPAAGRWRASLLNNLGMALHESGDDEAALREFRQAHVLREAAGQRREAQIARYMVGWALRLLGRFDEARETMTALRLDLVADGHPTTYVDEELARIEAGSTADA